MLLIFALSYDASSASLRPSCQTGKHAGLPLLEPPGAGIQGARAVREFHGTRPAGKRDFYEVLGVQRGADKSEVSQSTRC